MNIKVAVIFGGRSAEHEVSVISALQAMGAIDRNKYSLVPIYSTKEGLFYTGDVLLEVENFKDINQLLSKATRIQIGNDSGRTVILKYPSGYFGKKVLDEIDVAFPIVHGTNSEDGALQGFLETLNVPYVGSDILSSALGMDKIIMKKLLKEDGLPVVPYEWFYSKEWLEDEDGVVKRIEQNLGYPVIVKPANLGSSIGVQKAGDKAELLDAIDLAKSFANRIIVEKMVANLKEINCSVLGDYDHTEASVCEEPLGSQEILSYQDKYMSKSGSKGMSSTKRKLPADISAQLTASIQELAKKTFTALCCSGVSRVDFLIDTSTNEVFVNEINTIPGSLSFYLWEASGKPFSQLLDELIQLALKRSREKNLLIYSFEHNILSMGSLSSLAGSKGTKTR